MKFLGLHKSDHPEKKYYVELEGDTGRVKRIYFGAAGYTDYTRAPALEREYTKQKYIRRHRDKEDWNDPSTAGFWAKNILWNKPTVSASLRDTLQRYPSLVK